MIGVLFSVKERKFQLMWRSTPRPSPLSQALAQLVGTAGGIYLSLELLFTFLKVPEEVYKHSVFGMELLAFLALVLAIVQPFAFKLWRWIKR